MTNIDEHHEPLIAGSGILVAHSEEETRRDYAQDSAEHTWVFFKPFGRMKGYQITGGSQAATVLSSDDSGENTRREGDPAVCGGMAQTRELQATQCTDSERLVSILENQLQLGAQKACSLASQSATIIRH